jgi:hypothetical protein
VRLDLAASSAAAGYGSCDPNTIAVRWTQDDSGRVHTPFEPLVLAATLALIPVLIIEADTTSEGWNQFADVADWVIWAIFAVELGAVLIVAPRKMLLSALTG